MAENYDLIFGQSASQQYAWSDSNYQNGWQTVGSTPPTAEQFDALQRRSDTKAQDLNNRLEPIESKSEADGRQAATSYTAGAMLTVDGLPNGWLLQCIVPGISGTDAITLPDTLIDGLTIIDGDVTWALRKVATNGGLGYRQPSTTYAVGSIAYHSALPTGWYLECTTEGTTSAGDITPTSTIGDTVTDGTVVWTVGKSLSVNGGILSGTTIGRSVTDSYIRIVAGPVAGSGPSIILRGNEDASAGNTRGTFSLNARITDTGKEATCSLLGYANGRLLWNTNDLAGSAIVAKSLGSNGYIKYASGLIMQWSFATLSPNAIATTFPISFTSTNYNVFATKIGSTPDTILSVSNKTTTGVTINGNVANSSVFYFVIGY